MCMYNYTCNFKLDRYLITEITRTKDTAMYRVNDMLVVLFTIDGRLDHRIYSAELLREEWRDES